MRPSPIVPLLLGLAATVAHGQQSARIVHYHANDIVNIRARMSYTTLIELPATEKILDAATGDKDFWIVDTVGNYCFVHPAKQGIHSSLDLITDKGTVYSFTLDDVESGDPDLKVVIEPSDPSLLAIANGPDKLVSASAVTAARAQAQLAQTRAANAVEQFRSEYPVKSLVFDYSFHNKEPFDVSAIYHDDKFTYIKSSASEKFSVYELKDKKPDLITFQLQDGTAPAPLAASTDMNQRKIQELEQDLSADQRQSQLQAQAQRAGAAPLPAGAADTTNPVQTVAAAATLPPPVAVQPAEPPRDPIADAEKALEFKARFASNLVSPVDAASHPSTEPVAANADAADRSAGLPQAATAPSMSADTADNKRAPEVNLNRAHGQPYAVFEGTTIDTVLVDRLDGEFSGPVKVMVTNPVYSLDRQHVLIPAGTFIMGGTRKVSGFGQKRLAVTFHRMLMPDHYSVDLDTFQGLDQAGATGIKDKVNNHYVEIFGASIALGVIAGAAEACVQAEAAAYLPGTGTVRVSSCIRFGT